MSVSTPRSATLVTSPATVLWSDGSLFNGYVWLGLKLPLANTRPTLWNANRQQVLPTYIKVPIVGGIIDNATQIFYTSDMNPPGTTYVAYWFGSDDVLVAPASGTATPFSVTSTPVTLTAPTLTVPTLSGATAPVPQTA